MKIIRKILLMFVALSLPFLDIITFEFECDYLGKMGPRFYGFPFAYRTEIPMGFSLHGDFFLLGYIGNVLFFLLILMLLTILTRFVKLKDNALKIYRVLTLGIAFFIILFSVMIFSIHDWTYKWTKKDKTHYGEKLIDCERRIKVIKL